jgi:hypothetical protein
MIPIHQVLSRIQHDPEFGTGEFELGYVDRFDTAIHRVGLGAVAFPKGERRVFEMTDDCGRRRRIPFHRV